MRGSSNPAYNPSVFWRTRTGPGWLFPFSPFGRFRPISFHPRVLRIRISDMSVNYMYRCLDVGNVAISIPFYVVHQLLIYSTALYYRMAPPLARSTAQHMCDMLRSDEPVYRIARTAKCSRKAAIIFDRTLNGWEMRKLCQTALGNSE